MQKRSAHPRTHLRARGHIVGEHDFQHTRHRHAPTHASKHTHEKNTHGTGKNKEALVEGLVEKADFTILKKSCIPVELTRTAIWELDGSESSAAWDALDRMKKGEIVEWLMGGSQPTDGKGKAGYWFWQDDVGVWNQFDKDTNERLNRAYEAEMLMVDYSARGFTYRVHLAGSMKQKNLETGTTRPIRHDLRAH